MSVDDRVDAGPDTEEQQRITDAVASIVERREPIQRTIGMLMLIYDLNPEQAFDLLKWRSQNDNIKVRLLAQQVSDELTVMARDRTRDLRAAADAVLMTHRHAPPPDTMC